MVLREKVENNSVVIFPSPSATKERRLLHNAGKAGVTSGRRGMVAVSVVEVEAATQKSSSISAPSIIAARSTHTGNGDRFPQNYKEYI